MTRKIIITGITGVGKTTIGRTLANSINAEFIDLDKAIENHCGVDIPTIFAIEGETGFRKRERDELLRVLEGRDNYVLSLGGGCVIASENRESIKKHATVVIQLVAEIEILVNRLAKSPNKRPLLQNDDLYNNILELSKARKPFYNEIANYTINTSSLKPTEVISILKKDLKIR